jgi:hypothetical protein
LGLTLKASLKVFNLHQQDEAIGSNHLDTGTLSPQKSILPKARLDRLLIGNNL